MTPVEADGEASEATRTGETGIESMGSADSPDMSAERQVSALGMGNPGSGGSMLSALLRPSLDAPLREVSAAASAPSQAAESPPSPPGLPLAQLTHLHLSLHSMPICQHSQ